MRFIVIGCGAVGGTIAAQLALGGEDVVAVARGAHGEKVARDGLEYATPLRTVTVPLSVVSDVAQVDFRVDDVLMLAVKSQHTATSLAELGDQRVEGRPVADMLPVFCFQNGLDNERVALRAFSHVHGVSVRLPANFTTPGRVESVSSPVIGALEVGRAGGGCDAVDDAVVSAFAANAFAAKAVPDVMAFKRRKLLGNLGNSLEVLLDRSDADGAAEVRTELAEEAMRAFAAGGDRVADVGEWGWPGFTMVTEQAIGSWRRGGGSTWQSIHRAAGSTETDYLNGEVVLLGRLRGVPTPVNLEVQRMMRDLTDGYTPVPAERLVHEVGRE